MVLVLDMEVSERALTLRERVLEMGFPCAVSFPPFDIEYLRPIACALTFLDVAEKMRPSWLCDIPMLALGEGSVSKMLDICVLPEEGLLLKKMVKILCSKLNWQMLSTDNGQSYYLHHGFTMIGQSILYQIYTPSLRERDRRILMTILTSCGNYNSYRRIEAYSYPYPYQENEKALAGTISTHISQINRTVMACCGQKCIRYKRGGYVLCIGDNENKNEI